MIVEGSYFIVLLLLVLVWLKAVIAIDIPSSTPKTLLQMKNDQSGQRQPLGNARYIHN
jgi:hypothetical protein